MNAIVATETIDKLYLELSRVTKARTWKEVALQDAIAAAEKLSLNLCWQIEKCGASVELTKATVLASELNGELLKLRAAAGQPNSMFNQP